MCMRLRVMEIAKEPRGFLAQYYAQFGIHRRPRRTKIKQRTPRNAAVVGVGKVAHAGSLCRRGVAHSGAL